MRLRLSLVIAVSLLAVLAVGPAAAQLRGDIPRLFGEVQSLQALAVGPLVFEDADTAKIGDMKVQLFGVKAPNIDEACTTTPDTRATCGLIALTFTLNVIDGVNPVDCLIVGAGSGNTIFVNCLSEEFDEDLNLDRDTRNLGEILILSGYARADENFEGPEMGRYQVAELEAQRNGRGFWDCEDLTPRSWSSDKNRIC